MQLSPVMLLHIFYVQMCPLACRSKTEALALLAARVLAYSSTTGMTTSNPK
jgi:hypothetical protein